ncbi:PmbA protein [Proteiniborus ethanoligenes]|uniref:PmbA protein n=1 Tax=Proteiniborus ethanoligenes TaxID=415015 RepID=A0A1H3M939_9FIRM|nr:metallopeptidase TldD-related protein [Proteiniborus ethanoligenes]TAH60522.1 MAG: peptidase U62 [Gottschalkiaceae bacterium]SDY73191.1 PmbA protein [Proteiniborus ethanoligenes]
MVKEKYIKTFKEISINISQTEIKSVRKKDITKTGFRIYENGFIGIAGAVGKADEAELEKRAIENLKLQIPYPYEPSSSLVKEVDYRKETLSDEDFVSEVEELLKILREEFPDFIFSNNIYIQEFETKLINNKGLNLTHVDRAVIAALIIKEKASVNVFDAFASFLDREYSRNEILNNVRETLTAYNNKVKLPVQGKQPVVFLENDERLPLKKILEEMNGYKIGTGASLFKDFLGEKKFSDSFTLYQSTEREDITEFEFFDAEGVVNEDRYTLIENGKIITPYTDKKTAAQFNLPLTGSASADYDKVPSLGARNLKVASSNKTLKELLNGQLAIVVLLASGGDFTAEGVFGTPVQLGFLTDGEKLLGRLPELTISGELYTMFGDDYIGKSKDKALLGQKALAFNLNVDYI